MITVKANQVQGYVADPPYQRSFKCLLSPKTQEISGLGMGMVIIPPGSKSQPHFHEIEQETWFVISGNGKITIGKETQDIEPDMVIVAPVKKPHFITNDGTDPLKMLFIFTPPGPEEQHIR